MPIEGTCPNCGAMVVFPDHAVGRTAQCNSCLQVFKVSPGSAPAQQSGGSDAHIVFKVVMALAMTVVICAVIAIPLVGVIVQPGASPTAQAPQPQESKVRVAAAATIEPADVDVDQDPDVRRGRRDCRADYSGNKRIDAADLARLLGAWGVQNPKHGDLTADGEVDAADLAILLGSWGECE